MSYGQVAVVKAKTFYKVFGNFMRPCMFYLSEIFINVIIGRGGGVGWGYFCMLQVSRYVSNRGMRIAIRIESWLGWRYTALSPCSV